MCQRVDVQPEPGAIDYWPHLHGSTGIDQAIKGFVLTFGAEVCERLDMYTC